MKLTLDRCSKRYVGDHSAPALFEDFSMQIDVREVTCIVGLNGVGKSTLLRIMAGLEKPDSGVVSISEARTPPPCTGLLLQELGLFDWMTVREQIKFGFKSARSLPIGSVETLAADLGLEGHLEKYPIQLSGGLRQRCAMARLLASGAEFLLLDEPLSSIDPAGRQEALKYLEGLLSRTKFGFTMVTHSVDDAVLFADRVVTIGGHPATVLADVTVPLPRPRRMEHRYSADFSRCRREVESSLAHSEGGS